ncbi:MAG: DUF2789 domain-containing protein [Porticoccus sp.]|nr:DUF2789 domain-containing protein [Porticoccus sp.]
MDTNYHTLTLLFDQLGLPSEDSAIEQFLMVRGPLADEVRLVEASFWSVGQRAFLQESLVEDSDWSEVIDQLDTLLRSKTEKLS